MKRIRWVSVAALACALGASASPAPVTFVELAEGDGRVYDSRVVSITVRREGRSTWVTFERAIFVGDFEDGW